jgi:hypothetical protein
LPETRQRDGATDKYEGGADREDEDRAGAQENEPGKADRGQEAE